MATTDDREARLSEIRKRLARTTTGEWRATKFIDAAAGCLHAGVSTDDVQVLGVSVHRDDPGGYDQALSDVDFVAHARIDTAWLLGEIGYLDAEAKQSTAALSRRLHRLAELVGADGNSLAAIGEAVHRLQLAKADAEAVLGIVAADRDSWKRLSDDADARLAAIGAERDALATVIADADRVIGERGVCEVDCGLPLPERIDNLIVHERTVDHWRGMYFATLVERDALRKQAEGHYDRIAAQSEILSRRAEKDAARPIEAGDVVAYPVVDDGGKPTGPGIDVAVVERVEADGTVWTHHLCQCWQPGKLVRVGRMPRQEVARG